MRDACYVLAADAKRVYLLRRSENESVMPGLWELPPGNGLPMESTPAARFRHAIMTTDFQVSVVLGTGPPEGARAVPLSRLPALPLTGLARKILRHFGLL